MNNHGFVLLALGIANKIRHDWYWAMQINAEEKVFDKLRRDIKGDTFAKWCELINLHFANKHGTLCASPIALLRKLESDKANNIIPDMEEEINNVDIND